MPALFEAAWCPEMPFALAKAGGAERRKPSLGNVL